MAGRTETHYEVQVLRDGRWLIEATSAARDQAVAEAQQLAARPDVEAVRVINDRYDSGREIGASRIVYEHARQRRHQRGPRPRRREVELRSEPGSAMSPGGSARTAGAAATVPAERAGHGLVVGLGLVVLGLILVAGIGIALVG